MKRFTKYIRPYIIFFITGPIMILSEVLGEIQIPRLMSRIINDGVANHDMQAIFQTGGWMLLCCLIMVLGGVIGGYLSVRGAVGFTGDLRADLFSKVQDFSFADLDDFSTGSLVTRLTNDLQQIQQMLVMMLRIALRAPGMLIGGFVMAMTVNRDLAMILLVVIPLLALSIGLILKTAYPRFSRMQTALDALNNGIQESLTNVRVVKSFVREDFEKEKFTRLNGDLKQRTLDAMNLVIMTMPVMTFFMNLTSVAVVWFGGNRIIAGSMLVGDLTAFITYVTQILMSLMMLAMIILQSSRSMASFKRVAEVMDYEVTLDDKAAKYPDRKVEEGTIVFEDVSFSYPAEDRITDDETTSADAARAGRADEPKPAAGNVLEHISFSIDAGETVGILGATGCGKTSMVQLIPRLYDVTGGRVLVDGIDVRDYSLQHLRDGVGMVLQYNTLFSGTVEENLRWGREDASLKEVREYAEYAQADGFISAFHDGYDTMIEQGGTNVSGGQKQRLCIARALLKNPKILILDDSTSAVDTATEAHINEAFVTRLKDTTKLIIAQRIGSVINADRIIVMDEGRIVDIGPHQELIRRCGIYQEIYYSQKEKEEEVPA